MIGERLQFVADTLISIGYEHVSIQHGYVYVSQGNSITIRLYVDRTSIIQYDYFTVSSKASPYDIANFMLRVVNATAYLFV